MWVEIRNQGQDAYQPELYGDAIIVERRITKSSSMVNIKDRGGLLLFHTLLLTYWMYQLNYSIEL